MERAREDPMAQIWWAPSSLLCLFPPRPGPCPITQEVFSGREYCCYCDIWSTPSLPTLWTRFNPWSRPAEGSPASSTHPSMTLEAHRFLLGNLTMPQKINEDASTSQFPLFQFTLPVEMHQRRKAFQWNVNLSSLLSDSGPPGSSLGFSLAGFTSPDLAAVRSILSRQRPLLPHKGALFHQTFYTLHSSDGFYLLAEKTRSSQRKGKKGPTIGWGSSHIDIHSHLIITVAPRGRQWHSTLKDMKTEVQRSELFNWDINSGLHSSIWIHSLSHPPGHLLRPWSEHFAHRKSSWD